MTINKIFMAFIAALLFISLASATATLSFLTPENEISTDGNIDYNAVLSNIAESEVLDFDVALYTFDDYVLVSDNLDHFGVVSVSGSFMNLEDGKYILYSSATFNDESLESVMVLEVNKTYSVDNPITILFADPTPENNAIINSNNINSAKIVAVGDENMDSMVVNIFNESGFVTYRNYTDVKKTSFSILNDLWNEFKDGVYTFNVTAYDEGESVVSKTRTVTIKATVPNATDINITMPESVDEDSVFPFNISLNVSEQPVKIRIFASGGIAGSKTLANLYLTNFTGETLSFANSIANPGIYDIKLTITDDYGNSNSYELTNITVNDVAEPSERRNRRGNNNDDEVVKTINKTRFNLTLVDTNEIPEENETEEVETQNDNPGVMSFITGAVTGAFSTPPRAILTFIIIVIIIYAIIKIRGYVVADKEDKPKKNGKKKKDLEEEQESA